MENLNTHQKLARIQQEIKAPKSQYNSFGKYYYRSAEDILEAVKPFESKYGVSFKIDEVLKSVDSIDDPLVYIVATAIMVDHENGNVIVSNGNALIDFTAKGMQMPQRTGAASSYAKKYALGNLLLLDDTKDPDSTNDHGKRSAKAPPKPTKVKVMTKTEQDSFIKGIAEGKFSQVEKYLIKYANDLNKKAVIEELNKAKSGK